MVLSIAFSGRRGGSRRSRSHDAREGAARSRQARAPTVMIAAMTRAVNAASRRPDARGGPFGILVRCLLAAYLISLGVIGQHVAVAATQEAGRSTVEFCTVDGIRHVVVDDAGRPVGHGSNGHQACFDCGACGAGGAAKALCARCAVVVAVRSPREILLLGARERPTRQLALSHAPLPARGPPSVS